MWILKEITIFFGGSDNGILSFSVAKELLKFVSYRINIIISGFQKPYQKLIKLSNESNLIKIIQNKHTYSIFFRSKLYIGSSGLTAYEAYMSKIPGVIFSKSSNQKMNSIALKKRGFKCIVKLNGKYDNDDCDNKCAYSCSGTKCVKDPTGDYDNNKCDDECGPTWYTKWYIILPTIIIFLIVAGLFIRAMV